MRVRRMIVLFVVTAAACLTVGAQQAPAKRGTPRVIDTVRAAHELPPEEAAHAIPVLLRVMVTYYDPFLDNRRGGIFACDRTGCIFISVPLRPVLPLKPGSLVEVTGVSGPGDFASVVLGTSVKVIGQAPLPANPPRVTLSQLLTGAYDAGWVEIEGRVRSVHFTPRNVALEIATEGGTVDALSLRQDGVDYQSLVDSLIRLHCNAGVVFNQRRQMVGVHMFFPTIHEVAVIQPAPPDPFAVPAIPISKLFRFSPDSGPLRRVHVQGTVTLDWPGRILCIEDANEGICTQTTQAASVPVGAFVDVVGFPSINLFKPLLEDAIFHVASAPASPPAPVAITPEEAVKVDLDGKLVRLDAELVGRDVAAADPTVMLRAGGVVFPAILPRDIGLGGAPALKDGSLVRITGIDNAQIDTASSNINEGAVSPESVQILLRSVDDISVLKAPSWWTAAHTVESFSFAVLLVLASFTWIVVLRHRVAQQTYALRGSEERLRHLSEHDALTGLPNRILLNDRCQTSLKRAVRFQSYLGLLMVDADEFKVVNDALGHQAGDKLLCELAKRLCDCVRATDTVARIGGDEFIILLPDLRIPAEAESIAAKIVDAVAYPYVIDHAQAVITVSVGVVTYPGAASDLASLMHCADEAMYAAKAKGKNSFQVYRAGAALAGGGGNSLMHPPHIPLTTGGA